MNWFEEWFESPLYEKIYADRNEEEAEQLGRQLENIIPHKQYEYILDLGCGRGRHSLTLASKGYRVKGIDLSEEAIRKAREKAEARNLDNVDFEVRDMRNPLPEKFDAIVNLFTTFGYFKDDRENEEILDSVVAMLKPGGMFILDYLNARQVRKTYNPEDHGTFDGVEYNIERYIDDNAIYKEIHFSGEEVESPVQYQERVKLYELPWFQEKMGARHLKIDQLLGDYHGQPFDEENSPRLMIVSHLEK